MKNYTELKITSNNYSAHADFIGEWNKGDIEEEMRDLEVEITSQIEWIEWVLSHNFDNMDDLPNGVYDAILNDAIQSITFFLYGAKLTVTKS